MSTDTMTLIARLRLVAKCEPLLRDTAIEAANRLEELSHKVDDAHTMLPAEMSATQDMEGRAAKAERERDELAAKLPRYHDGRAFVPLIEPAWRYDHAAGAAVTATAAYMDGAVRLYPTAAECERGEGGGDAN